MCNTDKLALLKAELAALENTIFGIEMGDDMCYTNGRLDPYLHATQRLRGEIKALEAAATAT